MEIIFLPAAVDDLNFWKSSGNVIIMKKITQLIEAIRQEPFAGIGKPERLKHNWSGLWSRRITEEHRIVYKVELDRITIYKLRFHYL